MSKFIPGKEVLVTLRISEPDLFFDYVKKGLLQPYNRFRRKIPRPDWFQLENLEREVKSYKEYQNNLNKGLNEVGKKGKDNVDPYIMSMINAFVSEPSYQREQRKRDIEKKRKIIRTLKKEGSSWKNYELPEFNIEADKIIDYLVSCSFRGEDVQKLKKEYDSHLSDGKTVFPCKPGAKWEDIIITLVADDMVRIKTPQGEGLFTYHKLGMEDIRVGDKPTMLWELIKLFAKEGGFISSQNPKYDPKLPDTAKRLNRHLKELFGIDERIYTGHYKKEKGYKTKIKFYDRTS